jgi:hypothetical protein
MYYNVYIWLCWKYAYSCDPRSCKHVGAMWTWTSRLWESTSVFRIYNSKAYFNKRLSCNFPHEIALRQRKKKRTNICIRKGRGGLEPSPTMGASSLQVMGPLASASAMSSLHIVRRTWLWAKAKVMSRTRGAGGTTELGRL